VSFPNSVSVAHRGDAEVGVRTGRRDDAPMTVRLVRAPQLAQQVPYAYAAVLDPTKQLVFTAGACPTDADDQTVALGDVRGQAHQVMGNLSVALAAAGATLDDVVKTTVYVASTDRRDLVTAWDVVRGAFGDHDPPSTLVGVAVLGYEGQLVEVEAVAEVTGSPAGA
jgi:enamine deaminase RidA (YjgF/YER057c/UK114 family)